MSLLIFPAARFFCPETAGQCPPLPSLQPLAWRSPPSFLTLANSHSHQLTGQLGHSSGVFGFSFSIGQASTHMHTHTNTNISSNLCLTRTNLTVLHKRSCRSARFPKRASDLGCCFSPSATLLRSTMLFHSPHQLRRKRSLNRLVLYAVNAQYQQAPKGIHVALQGIRQCGIPLLSMTHAASHLPPKPSAGDSCRLVQVSVVHTCCCNEQFSKGLLRISKATTQGQGNRFAN